MSGVPAWAWLAMAAVVVFWALGAYNRVVALRAAVVAAWQQLDTLLQARQQAIGALVDAGLPALDGERPAIDAMVGAQVQVATAAEVVRRRPVAEEPLAVLAKSEAALTAALSRLVALVETSAALRSDDGSPSAAGTQMAALDELAPRLRFARQAFNDAAGSYNAAVAQFPTRLLNRVFGFQRAGTL